MAQHRIFLLSLAIGWTAFASGCSSVEPDFVPVSGTVLIDGEAVPLGTIRLVPELGRPVSSTIMEDGSFVLAEETIRHSRPEVGIPPGTYRVAIAASEILNEDTVRWHAPKKYADHRTSGLQVTVDRPNDSLVLELTWGGEEGPLVESSSAPADEPESESETDTSADELAAPETDRN